jgi:broad specificity phosphatase PhoE
MMGPVEPPAITRHRRPFLAPLWVSLLALVVLAGIGWAVFGSAKTTVVFLVRPVEKEPGTIDDPPLSPEGEARAQRLAQMFGVNPGGGRIEALYAGDDRRAEQTVAPLAERLHRTPIVFRDARAAAARALREHAGGTVLVVASSAAVAQMIEMLTGVPPAALQAQSDLVYVISIPTLGHAHLTSFRL